MLHAMEHTNAPASTLSHATYGNSRFFLLNEATRLAADTREQCRAAAQRTSMPLVFSHSTALNLMGISLPHRYLRAGMLHACVPCNNAKRHLRGVTFHSWSSTNSIVLDAFVSCVTPVQAWFQIAAVCSLEHLVIVGDRLTCMNEQMRMATLEEIREQLDASSDFHGIRNCRVAATLIREGTDSPQETLVRLVLVAFGLPNPVTNHGIDVPSLGRRCSVDMSYVEYKVCIEYDGQYHHDSFEQWQRDQDKREALRALGWDVIVTTRLSISDHAHRLMFAKRVSESLTQRGWKHTAKPHPATSIRRKLMGLN